jgi:hypothetical protein
MGLASTDDLISGAGLDARDLLPVEIKACKHVYIEY